MACVHHTWLSLARGQAAARASGEIHPRSPQQILSNRAPCRTQEARRPRMKKIISALLRPCSAAMLRSHASRLSGSGHAEDRATMELRFCWRPTSARWSCVSRPVSSSRLFLLISVVALGKAVWRKIHSVVGLWTGLPVCCARN